jgi:hypothetical protein
MLAPALGGDGERARTAHPTTISLPSSGTLQAIPACLCALDGVEAGKVAAGGPLGRGVGCIRRWPRLNRLVALTVVVTMHRFLSDGVACKFDRQSDRRDKAFDHGIPRIIEGCLTTSA